MTLLLPSVPRIQSHGCAECRTPLSLNYLLQRRYYWDLTIDTVAVINLVLAVGLSVDYSAHVGHSFMMKAGSRDDRMVQVTHQVYRPKYFVSASHTTSKFSLFRVSSPSRVPYLVTLLSNPDDYSSCSSNPYPGLVRYRCGRDPRRRIYILGCGVAVGILLVRVQGECDGDQLYPCNGLNSTSVLR